MSAIQNHAIQNVISRDITDENWLKKSTQKSKNQILDTLWLNMESWLISIIKTSFISFFKSEK